MSELFWLLLPVAAYSGWCAAIRYQNKQKTVTENSKSHKNYSEGINNLINTQPDKAVDIVIDKLDVTPDTVELHLALGNLFRRTGEVDRAIRLHQNLAEKHALSALQRENVLFELGQDYFSAGLLDRAERIFRDLLTTKAYAKPSIKVLIQVYQQEKDWHLAIEFSQRYAQLSEKSQAKYVSHFYCEMAEKNISESLFAEAELNLQDALNADKQCVRAYILLGGIKFQEKDYNKALKYYLLVLNHDSDYFPEVLENFVACLPYKTNPLSLMASISSIKHKEQIDEILCAKPVNEQISNKKATSIIENQLVKNPSIKLLEQYLYLLKDSPDSLDKKLAVKLAESVKLINVRDANYRCKQCGFTAHSLHWQCPSCSSWSSIKPK